MPSENLTMGLKDMSRRTNSCSPCGMRLECDTSLRRLTFSSFTSIETKKVLWSTQNFVTLSFRNRNNANRICRQEEHQTCKTCNRMNRCFRSTREIYIDSSGSSCYNRKWLWSRSANYFYRIHTLMYKGRFKYLKAKTNRVSLTASLQEMTYRGP